MSVVYPHHKMQEGELREPNSDTLIIKTVSYAGDSVCSIKVFSWKVLKVYMQSITSCILKRNCFAIRERGSICEEKDRTERSAVSVFKVVFHSP